MALDHDGDWVDDDQLMDVFIDERINHLARDHEWTKCSLDGTAMTFKQVTFNYPGPWCPDCVAVELNQTLKEING